MSRAYTVSCAGSSFFRLPSESQLRLTWLSNNASAATNNAKGLFTVPAGDLFWRPSITSSFVDLQRVHSILTHAPGFGSHNCVRPKGSRNITAKIPDDLGNHGSVHWCMSGSEHTSIECGVHSLSVLQLELRDVAGNFIDLRGGRWSCTLMFEK